MSFHCRVLHWKRRRETIPPGDTPPGVVSGKGESRRPSQSELQSHQIEWDWSLYRMRIDVRVLIADLPVIPVGTRPHWTRDYSGSAPSVAVAPHPGIRQLPRDWPIQQLLAPRLAFAPPPTPPPIGCRHFPEEIRRAPIGRDENERLFWTVT